MGTVFWTVDSETPPWNKIIRWDVVVFKNVVPRQSFNQESIYNENVYLIIDYNLIFRKTLFRNQENTVPLRLHHSYIKNTDEIPR